MKKVEMPLRFIKFLMKKSDGNSLHIMVVVTCMYMKLKTLFKIIRVKQDIENSIFHNLKTECGHEHLVKGLYLLKWKSELIFNTE